MVQIKIFKMDDIKAPTAWRRPRSKVYDYNQVYGGSYYQPMIDYLNTKERQGPYFERPSERVNLPDQAEINSTTLMEGPQPCGNPNVSKYLTKAYAQQIKEQNVATGKI
ncbi:uncharacterized protein LOC111718005 [Eurytemora carolleeae]|uniref:uncharacterized protein LOC111718005 n=1 Tax=Eurytemora carolleeae TaxID=1294199 RepID=UPI000C778841|nr:uncharacterized protein LOC111718005 [Eurytemora carolleeae]|eukprot:XP_023349242.1 uncharacterized protein LOC111718005 [Eurytemora affinis]